MRRKRQPLAYLLLTLAAVSADVGRLEAGPISGWIHEIDGQTPAAGPITILVFRGAASATPVTTDPATPTVFPNGSFNFEIVGAALPPTERIVRIEFQRPQSNKRVVRHINGFITAPQAINVTMP